MIWVGISMKNLMTNRNFVLLLAARLITNIGDSLYYVAAMWLAYKLGGSAFYSGLAGFLILLPQTLQFLVGPIVDHSSTRRLLILTQLLQAILLLLIPMAYYYHLLTVHFLLILMPILSMLDQFSFPAENSLITVLLNKESRIQANSLMAFAYQGTDVAFNAIGGLLLLSIGTVPLFSADVFTFLIAAALFKLLVVPSENKKCTRISLRQQVSAYLGGLKEGFSVIFHSLFARILITGLVANFALGAETAILPAFAGTFGDSKSYGFMLSAAAAGTLIGALIAPCFKKFAIGRLLAFSYLAGGMLWLLAALPTSSPLHVLFFGLSMVPLGLNNILGYTVMQNLLPQEILATVLSVMTSFVTCMMPLGSLAGGILSQYLAAPSIFALAAAGFLFIAVYIFSTGSLRRIPAAGQLCLSDAGIESADHPSDV